MKDTKINHEVIINVETGAYTANPPLDIHQGDSSHVLIIRLRTGENKPLQLKEDSTAQLSFSRENPSRSGIEEVNIVNYYRGVLSYIVSPRIFREFGRYTCRIDIHDCEHEEDHGPSVTFVINIAKEHNYTASTTEVVITEEFYNELNDHLDNENIHVNEDDRVFLNTFSGMVSEISDLLNTDFDSKIDSRVVSKTKSIIARSFVTVDFKSQMTSLRRDEVCEGKLVRVNYGDSYYHDGDSGTIDEHPYDHYNPEYYVCKLVGDNESIEWHKLSFGSIFAGEIKELTDKLEELTQYVNNSQTSNETRLTSLESQVSGLSEVLGDLQELIDLLNEKLAELDTITEYTETIVETRDRVEYCLKWGSFSSLEDIEEGGEG